LFLTRLVNPPRLSLSPTHHRMSPWEEFLRNSNLLPAPDSNIMVGCCPHTCTVTVNMGMRRPERVGMRSHYVSSYQFITFYSTLIRRLSPSVEFAVWASSTTKSLTALRLSKCCKAPWPNGMRPTKSPNGSATNPHRRSPKALTLSCSRLSLPCRLAAR
jgi:hypothetical protein